MKRFASLVIKYGGEPCGENDALHARVGKYAKALKAERNLTEMSERIIKSSISTFEAMNDIRNNKSFAHGVCQTSCPPISCGVSGFRGAGVALGIEPDWSDGLPVAGFA